MNSLLRYFRGKTPLTKSVQDSSLHSPIPKEPKPILPSYTFSNFPLLPNEIRQQIWYHALPGPRLLLIKRNVISHSNGHYTNTTTAPASYGGHQPSILHVNQESRREALRYLTLLWGTYWNLSIDTPYFELQETCFEIKNDEFYAIIEMAEMRRWGELDRFKKIAIDWRLWEWELETRYPNYHARFGRRFDKYEHPLTFLNLLPNIKSCTFVYTKHPWGDHELVVDPYVPWRLGPLTTHTTLDQRWEIFEENFQRGIEKRRNELIRDHELEIRVMAVHDRERLLSPEEYATRVYQPGQMIRLA